MKVLLILALIGSAMANLPSYFEYQKQFGKTFANPKEYTDRQAIFNANIKKIQEHNAKYENGEESYFMGINQFTDMTEAEFQAYINKGLPDLPLERTRDATTEAYLASLREKYADFKFEDEFSWVDQGVVSSPKNQGQCGSCTAFACTGAIESCFNIKGGKRFVSDLSEQYLVDCALGYNHDGFGAFGCQGAWPQAYFAYIALHSGGRHQNEANYPYEATDKWCRAQEEGYYSAHVVTDQLYIWGTNEYDLRNLVKEHGPVVTTLDATPLGNYGGGVISSSMCCNADGGDSQCTNRNNHAVLVVGYGSQNGQDYFLVKNSWGANFGENGYFKIKAMVGHCGFGWQVNNVPFCQ